MSSRNQYLGLFQIGVGIAIAGVVTFLVGGSVRITAGLMVSGAVMMLYSAFKSVR